MSSRTVLFISLLLLAGITSGSQAATESVDLLNPGFEEPSIFNGALMGETPQDWFVFTSGDAQQIGITDQRKRSGRQACALKAAAKPDAYQGMTQRFNVTPGVRYEFSVFAINDATRNIAGEAFGQVSIEWHDASGKEVLRTYGPTWNFELSPIRWEKFMVGETAPEEAATATAVITYYTRDSQPGTGCYIDDAKITARP